MVSEILSLIGTGGVQHTPDQCHSMRLIRNNIYGLRVGL